MTNEEAMKWLKTIQTSPKLHLIHDGHSEAIDRDRRERPESKPPSKDDWEVL